ncbi:response regulator [Anabaena cylindrica FACHB-243]|uniref:Response regulator receiver protein n=1 Tax=Anabaena cylindrica (strain ATCC 27899 / PCC 7122) TaxID=272123 RepID=K9ZBR3_ANACC|nr:MULTISPECIES: response regulator [Anabaena]AFZ56626.1 response regulator receiver protein [Anabaena cylindrica PCC 7122]MBD2416202.1 response regulator [Anabaena cylindrica FACHB-243]MBY5284794.1 response regulator [Anabaena sp. CCAP 1446/1C]MBY5310976.1 response regulator [Anabaena sp. CCAP 1446/1C]MCM2408919.1 response regulator [Anabaena sp. CCAP 1446/1C]
MMTAPLGSYRLFQKLHPLSLLAQLSTRKVTGCLSVFTDIVSWSIYLEGGKLTYATYSDQLFERLEIHLQHLNQQIPSFNSVTYEQMGLMSTPKSKNKLIANADYHAICWLVEQNYITSAQAGILIEELAKEVLESFLGLKEGNYQLNADNYLNELPKFCHLDLQLIVEHCQKPLKYRQNTPNTISSVSISGTKIKQKKQLGEKFAKSPLHEDKLNNDLQLNSQEKLYTIACIDDSQTVLNSIQHFLDEQRFSVVMINDPIKALMQIIRSKPDLILLDVEMPNLDGYELCSLLRRHSNFKNTPIIMVTGRTGFVDKAKAKIVRASGYLTKPFTREDLLKMVSKHIG